MSKRQSAPGLGLHGFKIQCVVLSVCLLAETLQAQTPGPDAADAPTTSAVLPSATFRKFSLGMSEHDIKEAIAQDALFQYQGETPGLDSGLSPPSMSEATGLVSLPSATNTVSIEALGSGAYISQAWFQFNDDKLYIMAFALNPLLMDRFSVYTSLVKKYGEPSSLNPQMAVWGDSAATRLSLETPLTVKYIDTASFNALINAASTASAAEERSREAFLNDF
jgi:hypothetical protein